MRRVFGFLAGMILRALVVVVVSCWAMTQMFIVTAHVGVPIPGLQSLGVIAAPDGLLLAALDRVVPANGFQVAEVDRNRLGADWQTLTGPAESQWSMPGLTVWWRTRQAVVQLGVAYPAAVVVLLLAYWWVRRCGRRTRLS